MTQTLAQVISVEKGIKSRTYNSLTELHRNSQKAEPFNAIQRDYQKLADDGEDLPSEHGKVKLFAEQVLSQVSSLRTEAFDVEATKDYANCSARSDVLLNGQVLIANAPTTYLLYLSKELQDIRTFVAALPVLDDAEDWTKDPNSNLFKTAVTRTHRTKKLQRPLVLFPATDKHPAQCQVVTEDVITGYWNTIKTSGAIPVPRKAEILARVDVLLQAVKYACEKANETQAPAQTYGQAIFGYLFA